METTKEADGPMTAKIKKQYNTLVPGATCKKQVNHMLWAEAAAGCREDAEAGLRIMRAAAAGSLFRAHNGRGDAGMNGGSA